MDYASLGRTGLRISKLGFGASPLGDVFGTTDPAEGMRAVHCAIDLGITFFDVAPYYGRTLAEERLGAALEGRRRQVVLATKCGRYDVDQFDFSAARIRASIDESLARLRTDYLDLFQAHDIEFADPRQIVDETIPAMRDLQRQGKARFVGITGLQLGVMRRVAEAAAVDSVLSYCRYNLLIHDLDELLTEFARSRGIGLINASPMLMGVLTQQGPPMWHPAPGNVKHAGATAVTLCAQRGASGGCGDSVLPRAPVRSYDAGGHGYPRTGPAERRCGRRQARSGADRGDPPCRGSVRKHHLADRPAGESRR